MKDRTDEDFSDVVTGIIFNTDDIVAVPNHVGVYYNPNAKEGFQYAAAFATIDEQGITWVETFGVEKKGTKFTIRGRYGSKYMNGNPSADDIILQASEMLDQQLSTR